MQRISVFEPYPMRDTVQHFCEKHLDKIKSYMDKVSERIPLPAKCTIEGEDQLCRRRESKSAASPGLLAVLLGFCAIQTNSSLFRCNFNFNKNLESTLIFLCYNLSLKYSKIRSFQHLVISKRNKHL